MKLAVRTGSYLILAAVLILSGPLSAQKVETLDGVKVVHNPAAGKWGKTPAVSLKPVRVIGDVDTDDENLAFNNPSDLEVDSQGRLYVLDTGNDRVQIFGPDAKFLKSIGRRGQGPGEFSMPGSLALDAAGNLYVVEANSARIQVFAPDGKIVKSLKFTEGGIGKVHVLTDNRILSSGGGGFRIMRMGPGGADSQKPGLPALVKVFDAEGKPSGEFGKGTDFKDFLVNDMANSVVASVDGSDDIYLVFPFQNRIEKFASDGRLLWRADRELPYSMEIKAKGEMKDEGGSGNTRRMSVRMPDLTRCAVSAAVDGKGRLWVVTMARQLRENEKVQTSISVTNDGGRQNTNMKTEGAVDLRTTDAYKLEVFDPEGALLGSVPVGIFVDQIFIKGNRLFLVDKLRGVSIHEFEISDIK